MFKFQGESANSFRLVHLGIRSTLFCETGRSITIALTGTCRLSLGTGSGDVLLTSTCHLCIDVSWIVLLLLLQISGQAAQ